MDKNSPGWDPLKVWGDARSVSVDQFEAMAEARKLNPKAYAKVEPPDHVEVWLKSPTNTPGDYNSAKLRNLIKRSFGIRLQSTGDEAFPVELERIVMQTYFVSPTLPCIVNFDQFILTPFTGPGQFDLVERDSNDFNVYDDEGVLVSGGESEVTIATKSGFPDGVTTGAYSTLVKVNTVNKMYKVRFVPGTAGDGIFSINVQGLNFSQADT